MCGHRTISVINRPQSPLINQRKVVISSTDHRKPPFWKGFMGYTGWDFGRMISPGWLWDTTLWWINVCSECRIIPIWSGSNDTTWYNHLTGTRTSHKSCGTKWVWEGKSEVWDSKSSNINSHPIPPNIKIYQTPPRKDGFFLGDLHTFGTMQWDGVFFFCKGGWDYNVLVSEERMDTQLENSLDLASWWKSLPTLSFRSSLAFVFCQHWGFAKGCETWTLDTDVKAESHKLILLDLEYSLNEIVVHHVLE